MGWGTDKMRVPKRTIMINFFFGAACTSHIMATGRAHNARSVKILMMPLKT